jgi:gamma-glutamylcyclotransferase
MYYFAYGSNMHPDLMSERCPSAEFAGAAKLSDYRLGFTRRSVKTFPGSGVADLLPAHGSTVWGALYRMNQAGLNALDEKEGAGFAYQQQRVDVALRDETRLEAITYTVIEKEHQEVPPSEEYLRHLIDGARRRGLPEEYVSFLESVSSERPNSA